MKQVKEHEIRSISIYYLPLYCGRKVKEHDMKTNKQKIKKYTEEDE